MNLALFIEELLWNHDCVIVPGWGGFVANYQSAQINPITHEIKPPSRQLGFNKHLTQQDGLLQSHISQTIGISLMEAQNEIQNWVKNHHVKLANGDKIMLPQLGLMALDPSGQLQFLPDDTSTFLKASFGLPTIQLNVTQPHKLIQPAYRSKGSDIKKWMAAAGIAITIGLGFFAVQKSLHNTDTAGWNVGGDIKSSSYSIHHSAIPMVNPQLPSLKSLKDLAANLEESEMDQADIHATNEHHNIIAQKVKKATPASKSSWVVGGVFVSKENAEKQLKQIRNQGFKGAKIISFQDKFYACYGEVNSEKEEIALRKKVAEVDPFAWTKR